MDSLIAHGDSVAPLKKKNNKGKDKATSSSSSSYKKSQKKGEPSKSHRDLTETSILPNTRAPTTSASKSTTNRHIKDLRLRAHLNQLSEHASFSKSIRQDAQELLTTGDDSGRMEVEDEMERTWRVSQDEIVKSVGVDVAGQRREWKLDGGPYRARYTRNGRHLAIAGKNGHVATFDWQVGTLHMELQLRETLRDITFLHDQSFVAVAQKQHVFIYDQSGVEIHRLSSHVDVTRLEFLPFHWLLASVGNAGYLKWTDTSTGTLISEQRTKLGACNTMAQNVHNAVIYLGHQNGTVTLRTPNLPTPPVTLLAHMGPVTSISVDASTGGRYMATGGADGKVKVWDCRNWKGCVREWTPRSQGGGGNVSSVGIELEWSQKGYLGVASGGSVNVFTPPTIRNEHGGHPPVYMTHAIPHRPLTSLRFSPFTDVLTLGHSKGLSSILVPGAGEPNFDSAEADPFENRKARREREVRALLDKIQPDLITLGDEFLGKVAAQNSALPDDEDNAVHKPIATFSRLSRLDRLKASGKADTTEIETEDHGESADEGQFGDPAGQGKREKKEKQKQRGKGKSLKRYLRKKRKNVVDPGSIAIRQKIEAQKELRKRERAEKVSGGGAPEGLVRKSALDRFRR